MLLIIDCETTFIRSEDGDDSSPYNPANRLLYVGIKAVWPDGRTELKGWFVNHPKHAASPNACQEIQWYLDTSTLLVGHNLKFDLQWLMECGFKIPYSVPWDTMLAEYVLARGQKPGMGLDASCARYGLPQKDNRVQELVDKGILMEDIPPDILEEYCLNDCDIEHKLYIQQVIAYNLEQNQCLKPTLDMTNEFMLALTDMERNGICIDRQALDKLEKEYKDEKTKLETRLKEIVEQVMGDTPINLDSPEQLSWVIYSRRVRDKHVWASVFNLGSELRGAVRKKKRHARMGKGEFISQVKENTEWLYVTRAEQCQSCGGRGKFAFTKKDGTKSTNLRRCKECSASGLKYVSTGKIAGLRQIPLGPEFSASGGFKTDGDTLEVLSKNASGIAKEFLEGLRRLSAISTYITSFIEGIRKNIRPNGLLHTQFMQAITATGRLSSRGPNFQNMPRGTTFPVRKVVVSRFPQGKIFSADYGKLEFITAVFMAGDKQGLEDIANDADIHKFTADTLTAAGQSTNRQDAKPHTFKPLYGGMSGTEAEVNYYQSFLKKYSGIGKWQDKLQSEAISTKRIRIPSGREYAFPNARRLPWGSSTGSTQIKNYPVQGFATGDIVPCAVIDVWRWLKNIACKSLLFLTVHDDIDLDIHPDELELIPPNVLKIMEGVTATLKRRYNIDFTIPLKCEGKLGENWLEGKKVKYA